MWQAHGLMVSGSLEFKLRATESQFGGICDWKFLNCQKFHFFNMLLHNFFKMEFYAVKIFILHDFGKQYHLNSLGIWYFGFYGFFPEKHYEKTLASQLYVCFGILGNFVVWVSVSCVLWLMALV
jgi:hypothetical protein